MTLADLMAQTLTTDTGLEATVPCQISTVREATTKTGKPYYEVEIADATASEKFKVWQDSPAFAQCRELQGGDCVAASGRFYRNSYGLNVDELDLAALDPGAKEELFAGPPERREQLEREEAWVRACVEGLDDPRLRRLGLAFLEQHGERFRRAAAARDYHHARRGGLLEHTAQMLRTANALATAYPDVNWDLVKTGVLFHDSGKLWENGYEEFGFVSPLLQIGEMLGHIPIGIELVNQLWRQLDAEGDPAFAAEGVPTKEQVRLHLLHLIASHHGLREYGSPVTPRSPEAWMLHYIDNIDAKHEILRGAYAENPEVAAGIFERKRPLEGRPVRPLPKWKPQENELPLEEG
ncbi:MAG: HD domain-containing protein [Verrucomicrobiota bacterium]